DPVVKAGIRNHHERWDGRGYPDGLAGEKIPRSARVIAVADAYDAMTSNRPYRDAMAMEKVYGEFIKCAGGQFDPMLAEIFVKMLKRMDVATANDKQKATGNSNSMPIHNIPQSPSTSGTTASAA
ncbi:MAG TPA: HD domain-containing phosphohydrolase, partial [Candidatus Wallbacteria bacterium]|nr:HD domain-containing phosphohydrolase [Candidatus Wallbacteria bacterium]